MVVSALRNRDQGCGIKTLWERGTVRFWELNNINVSEEEAVKWGLPDLANKNAWYLIKFELHWNNEKFLMPVCTLQYLGHTYIKPLVIWNSSLTGHCAFLTGNLNQTETWRLRKISRRGLFRQKGKQVCKY
jgi:hypothetical protein